DGSGAVDASASCAVKYWPATSLARPKPNQNPPAAPAATTSSSAMHVPRRTRKILSGFAVALRIVARARLDDVRRLTVPRRGYVLLPALRRAEPQLHPPRVARRDRAPDRARPRRNQLSAGGAHQARHDAAVVARAASRAPISISSY